MGAAVSPPGWQRNLDTFRNSLSSLDTCWHSTLPGTPGILSDIRYIADLDADVVLLSCEQRREVAELAEPGGGIPFLPIRPGGLGNSGTGLGLSPAGSAGALRACTRLCSSGATCARGTARVPLGRQSDGTVI